MSPTIWERSQARLLMAAAVTMVLLALPWLGYEFWRLLWQPTELGGRPVHPGAIDLIERFEEIRDWFTGRPLRIAVYPPASYLMLWPLLGWLPLQGAIALWAATTLAALGWLVALTVRESGVTGRLERVCVALIPLSMYATGATIGNGQLNVHLLPVLVAGILLLRRGPPSWSRDFYGSVLVLGSLVKPNISAPFFLIVALGLTRLRPFVLVVLGYVVLTLAASAFQPAGPIVQFQRWLEFGSSSAFYSSVLDPEAARSWPTQVAINTGQYLLSLGGLQQWVFVLSAIILAALSAWVYRHRHADSWLLLGVSAIAARFWTYHRWYDDLVMLLPIITLIGIARTQAHPARSVAGWLMIAAVITCLAPGGLFVLRPPLVGMYVIVQITVWLAVLVYLINWGRRNSTRPWGSQV